MGEKIKNTIVEALISDEVRSYYEELLRKQTTDILDSINDENEKRVIKKSQKYNQLNQSLKEENERLYSLHSQNEQRIKELEEENVNLRESSIKMQKEYETRISTVEENLWKANSIMMQQKKENGELRDEIQHLRILAKCYEKYNDVEEALKQYMELSSNTKERLKNIISNDNIYALIHAGFEWNNVEGLWNFCKRRIVENEMEDSMRLKKVFLFVFEVFNHQAGTSAFELVEPTIGERFDSDKHSILGTKTDGNIAKVQLPGIKSISTGKVIFKAVIEV